MKLYQPCFCISQTCQVITVYQCLLDVIQCIVGFPCFLYSGFIRQSQSVCIRYSFQFSNNRIQDLITGIYGYIERRKGGEHTLNDRCIEKWFICLSLNFGIPVQPVSPPVTVDSVTVKPVSSCLCKCDLKRILCCKVPLMTASLKRSQNGIGIMYIGRISRLPNARIGFRSETWIINGSQLIDRHGDSCKANLCGIPYVDL